VSSFSYRRQIASLRDPFRVVAPDLPGFGRTPAPDAGAPFPLSTDVLRGLVETLGLRPIHVVAHDWGGPVAMACFAEPSERLRSLTLINTTFRPTFAPPAYWRAFTAPVLGDALLVRANLFGRALQVLLSAASDPVVRAVYAQPFRSQSTRRTVLALERLVGYRPAMERVMERLPAMLDSVPTLVLWGQPDVYFLPRERRWLGRTLPHARTQRIPGAGHFPQEDAPDEVTRALEGFLPPDDRPP